MREYEVTLRFLVTVTADTTDQAEKHVNRLVANALGDWADSAAYVRTNVSISAVREQPERANGEGVTLSEWLGERPANAELRAAWEAGEDPTEYPR